MDKLELNFSFLLVLVQLQSARDSITRELNQFWFSWVERTSRLGLVALVPPKFQWNRFVTRIVERRRLVLCQQFQHWKGKDSAVLRISSCAIFIHQFSRHPFRLLVFAASSTFLHPRRLLLLGFCFYFTLPQQLAISFDDARSLSVGMLTHLHTNNLILFFCCYFWYFA